MNGPVFITGAGGFLGKALVAELARRGVPMRLLLHPQSGRAGAPDGAEVVIGDLATPASYSRALAGCATVVHLAALTGKAPASAHWSVNHAGTEALIRAAGAGGVANFLLVSSIAAGYANLRFYPYARSKRAAEAALRTSGLRHAILRPTLILGPGSPLAAALRGLALLPVVPLPGGGQVQVQPVGVGDVARAIARILETDRFEGETLDLGGPERMSLRSLLSILRSADGRGPARFLPLPLAPLRGILAALEPVARPALPATAGQMSLFGNESTARPNWLMDDLAPSMETVGALVGQRGRAGLAGGGASDRECEVLTRYLTGRSAPAEVRRHYAAALGRRGLAAAPPARFDRLLLRLASRGGIPAALVDAYAAVFDRHAPVRRRMVLLAAILENHPDTAGLFDPPPESGRARAILALVWHLAAGGLALIAGAALLLPLRLVLSRGGPPAP